MDFLHINLSVLCYIVHPLKLNIYCYSITKIDLLSNYEHIQKVYFEVFTIQNIMVAINKYITLLNIITTLRLKDIDYILEESYCFVRYINADRILWVKLF